MASGGGDEEARAGRNALLALVGITVVILIVMAWVLTHETTDAAGRRDAPTTTTAPSTTVPTGTSSTTAAPDKPGVKPGVRDLADADVWTTPIIGPNLQCAGPTWHDGVLAVGCSTHELKGFDPLTGDSLWSTKTDPGVDPIFAEAPHASGEHSFVTSDNHQVASVDAKTGDLQWTFHRDRQITSLTTSGTHVLMVGEGLATSIDTATGKQQWELTYPTDLFTTGGLRSDASETDFVVVSGTGVHSTRVDEGKERWRATVPGEPIKDIRATSRHTYLLSADGTLTALDASDGSVAWARPTAFPGRFQSLVGTDDTRLYIATSDALAAVNRTDGTTAWTLRSGDVGFPGTLDQTHLTGGRLTMLAPNELFVVTPETGVVTVKRQMNLGYAGIVHDDHLLTVLESTGNSGAPGRLVTFDLR